MIYNLLVACVDVAAVMKPYRRQITAATSTSLPQTGQMEPKKPTFVAMQRVGPFAQLPAILAELGHAPAELLRRVALEPATLALESHLPFHQVMALLDACERATGRADLGLLAGSRSDHQSLGLVGQAMTHASTLGEAIQDYVGVQIGLSQGAAVHLTQFGDCHAVGINIYDRHAAGSRQFYALAMAVMVNAVRGMNRGEVQPVEVHFSHRAPADTGPYRRLLGARVLFDQSQTCVVLPPGSLAVRNLRSDPMRRQQLITRVRRSMRLEAMPMSVRLRHVLRPLLTEGELSREAVAAHLGVHSRTLRRLLAREETSFAQERDRVRHTVACELLAMTDLKIGEVALALGYVKHSAFDEAFRRWSGMTPSAWRDHDDRA